MSAPKNQQRTSYNKTDIRADKILMYDFSDNLGWVQSYEILHGQTI